MANVKTTEAQWLEAREFFEAGLSLSQLVDRTGISKTQLSVRSKKEGWTKGGQKEQLVQAAVRVAEAKGTLTEQARSVHDEVVDEKMAWIKFLQKAAVKNVQEAMGAKCDDQADFRHRAMTINAAKENIAGKNPETAIQINNNQAAPESAISSMERINAKREKIGLPPLASA